MQNMKDEHQKHNPAKGLRFTNRENLPFPWVPTDRNITTKSIQIFMFLFEISNGLLISSFKGIYNVSA